MKVDAGRACGRGIGRDRRVRVNLLRGVAVVAQRHGTKCSRWSNPFVECNRLYPYLRLPSIAAVNSGAKSHMPHDETEANRAQVMDNFSRCVSEEVAEELWPPAIPETTTLSPRAHADARPAVAHTRR